MALLPGWATTSQTGRPVVAGRICQQSAPSGDISAETVIHHRVQPSTNNEQATLDNQTPTTPKKIKFSPPPPSPPRSQRYKSPLSADKCIAATRCKSSSYHAKSTSPVATSNADTSTKRRHRQSALGSHQSSCLRQSALYIMKLKERLVLGFSITAVLFTLILVIDLQMDLGMSGHHLVPSHGRVKFGGGGVDGPGSAYNSFRKRFLQRSTNGSREISSGGATTSTNAASQQQEGGHNGNVFGREGHKTTASPHQKVTEEEPRDDFSDLVDYVMNNVADVDTRRKRVGDVLARSSADRSGGKNPTLGDLMGIRAR